MPSYSPEFKEQVVRKMMPPHNRSVAELSQEMGVSSAALYRWKHGYRAKGFVVSSKKSPPAAVKAISQNRCWSWAVSVKWLLRILL